MCGIFALFNNRTIENDKLNQNFMKAKGRGPESTKYTNDTINKYTLGFLRLAINGLDEISDQPASSPETRAKPIKPTPPATKAEPATVDDTKVASEQGIGESHGKTSAPAEQPAKSSKTTPASSGRAPNDPREVKKRQLGSQHTPD